MVLSYTNSPKHAIRQHTIPNSVVFSDTNFRNFLSPAIKMCSNDLPSWSGQIPDCVQATRISASTCPSTWTLTMASRFKSQPPSSCSSHLVRPSTIKVHFYSILDTSLSISFLFKGMSHKIITFIFCSENYVSPFLYTGADSFRFLFLDIC